MNSLYTSSEPLGRPPSSADLSLLGPALRALSLSPRPGTVARLATLDDQGQPARTCVLGELSKHHCAAHGGTWKEHGGRYHARGRELHPDVQAAYGLSDADPAVDLSRLDQNVAEDLHLALAGTTFWRVTSRSRVLHASFLNDRGVPKPLLARIQGDQRPPQPRATAVVSAQHRTDAGRTSPGAEVDADAPTPRPPRRA